jgi:hypothetical protein
MTETTQDPRSIARDAAAEAAQDAQLVGDFVESIDMDGGVTDFRFVALNRGYEGWQWSAMLYHDVELDRWTVNETTLIPTDAALRPPAWVPWKDRLTAADLSVTDSIGTEPDDPRLEDGFRRTAPSLEKDPSDAQLSNVQSSAEESADASPSDPAQDSGTSQGPAGEENGTNAAQTAEAADSGSEEAESVASQSDVDEMVEEFDLSRRHVMSLLGRSETAKRWYEGPRGPKSLSTKTAAGKVCSTCGFFIPLKGDLNVLFGVCANKWSPDDGRVVSIDHGCGEHSEIEPPETAPLWVQSEPAFDDLHIDVVAQAPREERSEVELIEKLTDTDDLEPAATDARSEEHRDAIGETDAAAASDANAAELQGTAPLSETSGEASDNE